MATTELDRVKAIIAGRMGNREDLLEMIENELQLSIDTVLERSPGLRPWYLLLDTPDTSVSTVANQAYVSLPANFLAEYEYGFVRITASDGVKHFLNKADYAYLETNKVQDANGNTDTGRPTHYTLLKGRIQLYPVPDAVYQLELMYYGKTTSLKNSQDTNEHLLYAKDWLIGDAGAKVALFNQHAEAAKIFAAEAKDGRNRVLGETEERQYRNAWTGGASAV